MLTAKLRSGAVISLAKKRERGELHFLRKKETFLCPICSEKMILKLGEKRIPHFAHIKGSACTDEYDRESEYHMEGKLKLYDWLLEQGLSPILECYFPTIKQRADISFQYDGETFALEFQCSTISPELFQRRTAGYQKISVNPIWILGGKSLSLKRKDKASLSSFHYLFLKANRQEQYFLPLYCPQTNQFTRLENPIPISPRSSYYHFFSEALSKIHIQDLLQPSITAPKLVNWRKDLIYFKKTLLSYSTIQDPFLRELYSHSLNPYFLPSSVGIPLKLNLTIETSPFVWQTYIFLEHFHKKDIGIEVSFQEVYKTILKRERVGQIKRRVLPNIERNLLPYAIKEYLSFLSSMGILKRIRNDLFRLDKPPFIANNMEEKEREESRFYQSMNKSIH